MAYRVCTKECRTDDWKRIIDLQFQNQYDRIIQTLEGLTCYEIDIEEVSEKFLKEFPSYLEKYVDSRKEIKRIYIDN